MGIAATFGESARVYTVRSEGLEPPAPWFEAWCCSFKSLINQYVETHQIVQVISFLVLLPIQL